jgi:tetratricopeptide (TPR) repeat protein
VNLALKRYPTPFDIKQLLFLVLALLLAGCSLEKESKFNKAMQNLTAHYNILYNANDLLRQKQENYQEGYIDAYDELLSVYQDTVAHSSSADKELDAVITKANNIISIKEQSHYIGDAYLVLGKANHLYGNYFNSVEFFRYVTMSFPKNKDLVQEARVWQVRSLLYLNQIPQARVVLDSAINNINPKKSITGDVYATALQYDMNTRDYPHAEEMAKEAIKFAGTKHQRLRWTFILAQLQELNKEPKEADLNYIKVVKSNASFEMAFNADLNRIRLEDKLNNRNVSRMDRLRHLLRDDKNADFIDQIYYQIALLYLADNDIDNAVKNLQLSVRKSTKNQNQKGLSYLRLADINFKIKADYVKAKKYYDSTLMNLSPGSPNYALIQKKSNNLQILADRLSIIAYEDTLQSLAKLDDKARTTRIDEMVNRHTLQMQAALTAAGPDPFNNAYSNANGQSGNASNAGSFYFYNSGAISQGYTDFKRFWGNRKLEDNWRRSKRASGDITANTSNSTQSTDPGATPGQIQKSSDEISEGTYRQSLLANIPTTPLKLEQSNQRMYNAYTDIANFYRDILEDKKESIETFETILGKFPNDPNKPAIYYNLYRLYTDIDKTKSDYYKDLLLKGYPESIYAKVILDPDYSRRLDDKDAEYNALYNQVYDLYAHRKYKDVITKADSLLKVYPTNKFSAQLMYLSAIANGHQEKLDPFRNELLTITTKYPDDRLITPLINQHMVYIDANKERMAAQEFALIDSDPDPFIPPTVQQAPPVIAQIPVMPPPVTRTPTQSLATQAPKVQKPTIKKPALQNPSGQPQAANILPVFVAPPPDTLSANKASAIAVTAPVVNTPAVKTAVIKSIFTLHDSTNYYFVVNVSSGTTNLSSSRFGIGQFNRANYQSGDIKHQLKNAGADNQLIYVGRFSSLKAVKDYARAIAPLMPQIMKVPADKYMFFIITQENLDKLADKKTLDSYIDFYQKNY